MANLKLAIGQMESMDSFSYNLEIIENLVQQAAKEKAKALFLPENCLYMRLDKKTLPPYLNLESGEIKTVASWAKENSIYIHLGGVGLETSSGKFNSSIWISDQGDISHSYNKQKLFDIELPGKHSYRESDAYDHGSENSILEFSGFRFGQSICYDLRFSEIYNAYALKAVEVLLIPSSFLVPTGRAHWHILNRARAIESQAYVISAAQVGDHQGKHQSFGHSLVIDPWGEILVDLQDRKNGIAVFDISNEKVKSTREQMPMRS